VDRLVARPSELQLGERWQIAREIGRGERSVVYEALDRERGQPVALKLLQPPRATRHLLRERLRRDLQRLRLIEHPGIVRLEEVFDAGENLVVAMELVAGRDLESHVQSAGPLPAERVRELGLALADALGAAHRGGLLHRDVKPRNVLLDAEGRARLGDFGCARVEGQSVLAEVDEPVADPTYLAPELASGRTADARADLYALGLTLYFALVGRGPQTDGPQRLPPPRPGGYHPRERRPDVPPWLDTVVARATSAEPSDRFETAERLLGALRARALEGRSEGSADPRLLDVCVVCRQPGTLGRAVCPHCEDESPADTLVLLRPAENPAELADRARILAGLTDQHAHTGRLLRVARGTYPLVRVSRSCGLRLSQRLAPHGLPARLVPAHRAWSALPRRVHATLSALPVAGLALAALQGSPGLACAALSAGALGVILAHLRFQGVALLPPAVFSPPPRALVHKVMEVMPQLELDEPRRLLVEALRLGRDLHARLEPTPGGEPVRRALAETLIASADAARELSATERALAALVLHGEHRYEVPEEVLESRALFEGARGALVHCLLETTAALSHLRGCDWLDLGEAEQQLSAATQVLSQEAELAAESTKQALGALARGPARS
jgi:hypothetical protein